MMISIIYSRNTLSHLFKVPQRIRTVLAHFRNQRHARYQNACGWESEHVNYLVVVIEILINS